MPFNCIVGAMAKQVTTYLPDGVAKRFETEARAQGLSAYKLAAKLIEAGLPKPEAVQVSVRGRRRRVHFESRENGG